MLRASGERAREALWGRLLYAVPLLFIAVVFNRFIFLKDAAYSDLTIAHLPNLQFLGDSIRSGHFPLWSPSILGGFPFFADPLSGSWYPPGWLAAWFPEAWAFNLLAALHLVFGMVGMQRYLREIGLGRSAAAAGSLAFGLLPKLIAHYAAGHVTLLYASAWTPWLLYAEHRMGRWFRPGSVLGVIFLADPRWAAFSAALWAAYGAAHSQFGLSVMEEDGSAAALPGFFKRFLIEAATAVLIAGPLLVPLVQYSVLSSRAGIRPEETLAFSLPPARLVGLVLPLVGGQVEWVLYAGAVVLAGSLAAVITRIREAQTRFWIAAAVVSLLFSLGDQVPVLRLWASIPGANLLRVPSRALILFGISLVVLMAQGLDSLADVDGFSLRSRRMVLRLTAGLAGLSLGLLAVGTMVPGELRAAFLWSAGGMLLAAAVIGLRVSAKLGARTFTGLVLFMVLSESVFFSGTAFETRSSTAVFSEGAAAAAWLAEQPGRFRVYSPSYSIPQHTAVRYGLELADGVDPLHLQAYADFMAGATGVPLAGYSVTVPSMAGDPASANSEYAPVPDLLGLLNVRFVASEFDLAVDGLELRARFGSTRIYENARDRGRVWFEGESTTVPDIVSWTPNRILVRCDCGMGRLVLSEIDYPGWKLPEGSSGAPYAGILRTIETDGTEQIYEMAFQPITLYVGLLMCALGIGIPSFRREEALHDE